MGRFLKDLADRGELLNVLTHAVGMVFAVVALDVLIVSAMEHGDAAHVVSFGIFGVALVLVYLASVLFHIFDSPRPNGHFHAFDQVAIYLMIAGTYTPFMVLCLRGPIGWTLLGLVWAFAAIGIFVRMFFHDRHTVPSYVIFLVMGWLVVFALKPVLEALPRESLWWLLAGGLSYTVGVGFLIWRRLPYHHAIWHLFVIAGSACHFFAVLLHT